MELKGIKMDRYFIKWYVFFFEFYEDIKEIKIRYLEG